MCPLCCATAATLHTPFYSLDLHKRLEIGPLDSAVDTRGRKHVRHSNTRKQQQQQIVTVGGSGDAAIRKHSSTQQQQQQHPAHSMSAGDSSRGRADALQQVRQQ
jgi:hypothetical protein